ncbi:MAG TPA: hypothetical protein ENJ32_05890 [Crenotrichaceae bacterium]|nr:hypothetical protein [Crenotrichaceae bacterium]
MNSKLKFFPIILSLLIVSGLFAVIAYKKNNSKQKNPEHIFFTGEFDKQKTCRRSPRFLQRLHIRQPIVIDLSQQRFTGIVFYHGQRLEKTLHAKRWEKYGSFGTYSLDEQGNLYLAPIPHISIGSDTFEWQKNIYRLDSVTGDLSVVMHFDDVSPNPKNPYGIQSLVYDCDDKTLWVSAIDETDFQTQKGVIYHIDPETKQILQRVSGFDALTITLLHTTEAKYLLAGSAVDDGLYAYLIVDGKISSKPVKLFELSKANNHIRKIKIRGKNYLELQAIPFSYTLIAQTTKQYRNIFNAKWDTLVSQWTVALKK